MRRKTKELNTLLNKAIANIREEQVDAALTDEAKDRVWERISTEGRPAFIQQVASEQIESCADFQSLMPAFTRNELSPARALLLQDHTHECVPCRRALKEARTGVAEIKRRTISAGAKKRFAPSPMLRWAIAASLVVGFILLAVPLIQRFVPFGSLDTTVLAAEGSVYKVGESGNSVLGAGAKLERGEVVRTAKDGRAVLRLSDGSTVELNDRSEVSIDKSGHDTTIHLDRGNVIVQAAKQKSGRLYVATGDALVSVTGTIFSVGSGLKGSIVSVVQGDVQLDHAGNDRLLHAGEQGVTSPALESRSVQEEIKWSRNAEKYSQLLAQLSAVRKELNAVPRPGVRTSTRLLDLMPENTVLYAALPNLAQSLAESNKVVENRINQNPVLRQWWEKREGREQRQAGIDRTIEKIRQFGEVLGDEIAVAGQMDAQGKPQGPLVLASLKDADGFRKLLDEQLNGLTANEKNGPRVVIVTDLNSTAEPSAGSNHEVFVWIHNDLLVASPRLQQLQEVAVRVQSGASSGFQSTQFHQRIADVYSEGAGLLVAADLEKIIATQIEEKTSLGQNKQQIEGLKQLGVTNLKYFVAEQKDVQEKTLSRAVLGFNESNKGITSWLAAPGPMGSLDYISPDANVAAAFVVKQPSALVDDILGFIETAAPDFGKHLKQAEAEHNIDLRTDIAAPLGGEFAFAIDGPILPTPSWKMVFEVNDPARMQQTFEHVVSEVNKEGAKHGLQLLAWDNIESGGRTFYQLRSVQLGLEVNYTFVNGYLVAAPSRALVDSAIRYHDSGLTLKTSKRFQSSLPSDNRTNFSAVFYHDLAALVGPIAQRLAESGAGGTDEKKQALMALAADTPPTLAYAYAQGDRIVVAANTEGGPFGLGTSNLLGMPNAFDIQHIIQSGMRGDQGK